MPWVPLVVGIAACLVAGGAVPPGGADRPPAPTAAAQGVADAGVGAPDAISVGAGLLPTDLLGAALANEADMAEAAAGWANLAAGDLPGALSAVARIADPALAGPLTLALLRARADAPLPDIVAALERFGDVPGAVDLATETRARQPDAALPPIPDAPVPPAIGGSGGDLAGWGAGLPRAPARLRQSAGAAGAASALRAEIESLIDRGQPVAARTALMLDDRALHLSDEERDQLAGAIARGLFRAGRLDEAEALARRAGRRDAALAPDAVWIEGLAAWRRGRPGAALGAFARLADAPGLHASARSAATYWAARAAAATGDRERARTFLARSAAAPATFYGRLAAAALALSPGFRFDLPAPTAAHGALIAAHPGGRRALLLLRLAQRDAAEAELEALAARDPDPALAEGLLALADAARLPRLAMRLGHSVPAPGGGRYESAFYPIPPWSPPEGFRVEPALVYAFMRQESLFDPEAESHAGATGLMQLMPGTAAGLAGAAAATRGALTDPEHNLGLGDRYLSELLQDGLVAGNLIALAAAYNAGPGNLAAAAPGLPKDDPLAYLESLPWAETRLFVRRVLTNYWMYRARFGAENPSLAELARDEWPRYRTEPQAQLAESE